MEHWLYVDRMELVLTDKSIVIYSPKDHDLISKYKWCMHDMGYCVSTSRQKGISMHRLIMNCPKDMVVDHINGNRLDNRRENLRVVSLQANAQNRTKLNADKTTSKYIGVCKYKSGRFRSHIKIDGRQHQIGYFATEIEAAVARDLYIVHELPDSLFKLNFPERRKEYAQIKYKGKKKSAVKKQPKELKVKSYYNPIEGDDSIVALIITSKPESVVLIDKEDYESIKFYKFHISKGYVASTECNPRTLHRFIMGVTDPKVYVDHIDGNPLNNTRSNLRLSNAKLNAQNRAKSSKAASKYHGVYRSIHGKRWISKVTIDGIEYNIGVYDTEKQAAVAYDEYITSLDCETHHRLNFPGRA
jgi:hypothetical protein